MKLLNPHIRFDGNCREAMTFYKDCFGGELSFMVLGESPMAKDFPADKQGLIMHSFLQNGPVTISGSDMMRDKLTLGDSMSISLDCSSEEELHSLFDKLEKGGEVFMPAEKQFWGAIFGMVTDKYGVEWMLNYTVATK